MERIFRYPVLVGPESIDALGHANNKEYLRWMEEAALAHSGTLGWSMKRYFELGAVFVAKRHMIEYLRPTFNGDQLTMFTWVETMGDSVSRRSFCLKREKKICMRGSTEWAFVSLGSGRSQKIPEEVSASFPIVLPGDPELQELGLLSKGLLVLK